MNFTHWLGDVMAWSARRRRVVLTVALVLSLLSGGVLLFVTPQVETDVQAGTFPRGDPQAEAFRDLRKTVAGINSELVYFELEPDVPFDVRSREAALEIDALYTFVHDRYDDDREQKVLAYTGWPYLVKLVYSYFPDGSFAIPPTQEEYDAVVQILEADPNALAFYFSDDNRATIISILYDPAGDKAATAGRINDLIAEYREGPHGEVWQDAYLDGWGIQSWIDRVDRTVERDLGILLPACLVALFALLWVALRDPRRAAIGMMTVGAVQLWTLAAMTILGLPIGFISMALFPLLLGVGVDYAVHVQHEADVMRATRSWPEALQQTGRQAGAALAIATATTVAGFSVIMISQSPMMIEVATATIIGMVLVLIASLTMLPALMSQQAGRPLAQLVWVESLGRGVARHRILAVVALVALLGATVPYVPQTEYAISTVEGNLPSRPEKAHMLQMYERFQVQMRATGQESFIHQGDLTEPAAMEELVQFHMAMEEEPLFAAGVLSLPFVVDLYATLEGGGFGPLSAVPDLVLAPVVEPVQPREKFARARALDGAQLDAAFDGMWNDARWAPLLRSFTDAEYDITWTFSFINIEADAEATAAAEALMRRIQDAVDPAMETSFFGTLTALKRINDQAAQWLAISAVVDLMVLGTLVGVVTRSWRAVVAVSTILGGSMVVWLGLLASPLLEIHLSFVYLIPLAFITSLGSDYAVHLVMGLNRSTRRAFVYRTIGRAIVYSALTTAVAFTIFSFGSIRGSWEMFQATVVAILVSACLTLLLVPVFYPLDTAPEPNAQRTVRAAGRA